MPGHTIFAQRFWPVVPEWRVSGWLSEGLTAVARMELDFPTPVDHLVLACESLNRTHTAACWAAALLAAFLDEETLGLAPVSELPEMRAEYLARTQPQLAVTGVRAGSTVIDLVQSAVGFGPWGLAFYGFARLLKDGANIIEGWATLPSRVRRARAENDAATRRIREVGEPIGDDPGSAALQALENREEEARQALVRSAQVQIGNAMGDVGTIELLNVTLVLTEMEPQPVSRMLDKMQDPGAPLN